MNSDKPCPWYRQFWPWFIIALPATVVVASIGMLVVAIRHDDSTVRDNYYRDGLAINQRLAEDDRARQLALDANLMIDNLTGDVRLTLTGKAGIDLPDELVLAFTHPLKADADFGMALHAITRGGYRGDYRGDLTQPVTGRWHIELREAGDSHWRLRRTVTIAAAAEHQAPQQWRLPR